MADINPSEFGKRVISSNHASELESLVEEAKEAKRSAFEEKLRVEGVKSTVDRDKNAPNYQRLDLNTSRTIDVFFKGISKKEFERYAEDYKNQGISSGGEPFKCYVEMNGNGHIIVTPNKLIQVESKDKENGVYRETRRQNDGSIATVSLTKTHGDITEYRYSRRGNLTAKQEKIHEALMNKYGDPNKIKMIELQGMNEQERITYTQTLQKLGIRIGKYKEPSELTKEEYEQGKAEGKMVKVASCSSYSKNNEFRIGNCIYDSKGVPIELSFVSAEGCINEIDGKINEKRENFKTYRRTADGKYFDSSSYRIENGKPVYTLLDYSEVMQEMDAFGIPVTKFEQMQDKVENDLQNSFPKEAEKIADRAAKTKEEQNKEQEEDDDPHKRPSDRV